MRDVRWGSFCGYLECEVGGVLISGDGEIEWWEDGRNILGEVIYCFVLVGLEVSENMLKISRHWRAKGCAWWMRDMIVGILVLEVLFTCEESEESMEQRTLHLPQRRLDLLTKPSVMPFTSSTPSAALTNHLICFHSRSGNSFAKHSSVCLRLCIVTHTPSIIPNLISVSSRKCYLQSW